MVETEYFLEVFRTATIGTNGQASIKNIGPTYPGERWEISKYSVSCTQPARFQVFRGNTQNNQYQIDFTEQGIGDISETNDKLRTGDYISFLWSRSTNGATGTIRIEGKRFLPGRRAY